MMVSQVFRPILVVFGALLLVLGGCAGTHSSKFYMLESMSGSLPPEASAAIDRAIFIGVGPVTLPSYVDRPQIVTRTSGNTVELAEFDRWAEPLSSNVSRTLTENLAFLLSTDSVVPFPWPGSVEVTYQVLVDVYRLDGILGDRAFLDAQWSILEKKGKKMLVLQRSTFVVPMGGPSFGALVTAQSRALGDLSREIALALKALPRDKNQE